MKRLNIIFFLACIMISLAGCITNNNEPKPVIDYGGISDYYIANQSDIGLNVTFKIRATGNDSTVTVPVDSTVKIFKDGGIGGSVPVGTFSKLSFYKLSDNTPLLVIQPIVHKDWNDVTTEEDSVQKYELVITEEDLQ